jgi:hypothetical protein
MNHIQRSTAPHPKAAPPPCAYPTPEPKGPALLHQAADTGISVFSKAQKEVFNHINVMCGIENGFMSYVKQLTDAVNKVSQCEWQYRQIAAQEMQKNKLLQERIANLQE